MTPHRLTGRPTAVRAAPTFPAPRHTDGTETARHMQAYKQENTLTTGKKPPEGTMIRPFFRTFAIRFK